MEKSADGGYEVNENGMTVPVINSVGSFYSVPKEMHKIEKKSPICSPGHRITHFCLLQMGVKFTSKVVHFLKCKPFLPRCLCENNNHVRT